MTKFWLIIPFATSALFLVPTLALANNAFPTFPASFYGTATLNGNKLPAGTKIQAFGGNTLKGEVVMNEDGIYGYNNPAKRKLVVGEYDGELVFKYIPSGMASGLAGDSSVVYSNVFVSGSSINLDLNFTKNSPTLTATSSEATITASDTATTTIAIASTVTDPKINFSSMAVSSATSTQVTIAGAVHIQSATNLGNIGFQIPSNTLITAPLGWTGVINAPTIKSTASVTATADSGKTTSVSAVIEVGFDNVKLILSKAARLVLAEQAGKNAGYSRAGNFTKITSTCIADTQISGDTLSDEGDCKIDVGSDLVIWTKHFTSFVTYTQSAIIAPPPTQTPVSNSGGGGGGGGGAPAPTPTDASAPAGVSIAINNGAVATTNKTVALILSASDSSSIQMMISNDHDFNGASWENYSTTKSWVLTGENGTKTVYAKFKDAYNNISSVVYKSISLNSTEIISEQNTEPKVIDDKITSPIAPKAVLGEKIVNQSITIKKDLKKEKEVIAKYTAPFTKGIKSLKAKDISKITNFIAYGTLDAKTIAPAINALSVVDRYSVLNDYKIAFGRVPAKASEWNDVVKIASGSLPKARSARREALGKSEFRKIFKRSIKANNAVDNLTVGIIAYGVKAPVTASAMNKAKKTFVSIYKRQPKTASNMNIVRAIAYRGVK